MGIPNCETSPEPPWCPIHVPMEACGDPRDVAEHEAMSASPRLQLVALGQSSLHTAPARAAEGQQHQISGGFCCCHLRGRRRGLAKVDTVTLQ